MATPRQIDRFRHFNRFYTEYLGLLVQGLYHSPVNLTEARVLYELDARPGSSARDILRRLTLDKGQLSRLLRRFARQGWVAEAVSDADARIKELRLTPKGASLMAELHERARTQALAVLDPMPPERRARLLDAMAEIEKILSE